MAGLSKPFWTFIVGGTSVATIHGLGGFRPERNTSIEKVIPASDLTDLNQKVFDINEFITIGSRTESLFDLVKGYGLTLSGAKDIGKFLSTSLILDLVDNFPTDKASLLQKNLKNKLDNLRLNSLPTGDEKEKEKTYKQYGGEDKYKTYKALQGIRQGAIDELINYLPNILKDSESDLKGTKSSDDLVKDLGLGNFYDKLLDDYIEFNRPLFIKRWALSYSSEQIEEKVKALFKKLEVSVPSDFKYPDTASYLFPYVKDKEKWDEFLKITKEGSVESKNTNDLDNSKLVVPLSVVEDSSKTSQFIISILKLHKGTVSSAKLSEVKYIEQLDSGNKQLDEIKETDAGIYFKDKNYIQLIQKDSSKTSLKADLIKAAKNESKEDYKFDLKGELKKWLEKHFERLFLASWGSIKGKQQAGKHQMESWDSLASSIKDLLEANFLKNSLVVLRKNVMKDYYTLIQDHRPIKWGGETKLNPLLYFAGKFPFELNKEKDNKNLSQIQTVVKELEDIYLSGGKTDRLEVYGKQLVTVYQSYKKEWEKFLNNKNSNELTVEKKVEEEDKERLFLFKESNPTGDSNKYFLQITNLFNNLWISMVHDGKAKDYLFQNQINKYAKDKFKVEDYSESTSQMKKLLSLLPSISKDFFNSDAFKKNEVLSGVGSDAFESSLLQRFSEVLFRRYALAKSTKELKDAIDPAIYGKTYFSEISGLKAVREVKELVDLLHDSYSDDNKDLLSEYQKEVLAEMLTIEFLSKDKFNALRRLLKHNFPKNGSLAFIFTKKYKKDDICVPDENNVDIALKLDVNKVWEFNNEYLGHTTKQASEQKVVSWNPQNCLSKDDFYDFALLKADNDFSEGKVDVFAGYKGLVSSEKFKDVLPEDIANKLKKLPVWGNVKDLVKNIQAIKTLTGLEELIKSLKETFTKVSWSFVEEKYWVNENADYDSKDVYKKELDLEERKNILIGFLTLSSESVKSVNENSSIKHKHELQKKWAPKADLYHINSFLKSQELSEFRHNGFFKDNGSKVLVDKDGNKHIVYMTQLKHIDLKDQENWESFLKEVSSDLIADVIVKSALDKGLQKQVIYHLLNEMEGGINKIKFGDSRLINNLDFSWMVNT